MSLIYWQRTVNALNYRKINIWNNYIIKSTNQSKNLCLKSKSEILQKTLDMPQNTFCQCTILYHRQKTKLRLSMQVKQFVRK
jgi:hypothetical protein